MNNSLISVIVPAYNCQEYIVECINSIKQQTYQNIEIIIVDDGSRDGTGELCDLLACDKRIIVVHQENKGVTRARLTGVERSSGDFVYFVDADDSIDNDTLELMLDCFCEGVDIIAFESSQNRSINAAEFGRELFSNKLLAVWGKLYRRSLFVGEILDVPRKFNVGEDFLMQLKLLANISGEVRLFNRQKYNYRANNPNSVQANNIKTYEYERDLMNYVDEIVASYDEELKEEVNKAYFRWRMRYLSGMMGLRYPIEADASFVKGIVRDSQRFQLDCKEKLTLYSIYHNKTRCFFVYEKRIRRIIRALLNLIRKG